ncbi:MAG TPA: ATP-binding protein [Solirubrobacteraceae bacterium]|jgi:signal transduction histidine kinase|nr:ATP-binding protein [Solirubrobacteraceae bacterium]
MAPAPRKVSDRTEKAAFTVDTQLFRELGELLVGRDATALLELVKNAYDADATVVIVHGQKIDSERLGSIVVSDDGTGMTLAQFREGFLRLAGRTKAVGERRSSRYGRRYTGEKGVGRLATHKLARVVEVDSVPWSTAAKRPRAVRARIDWREVERRRTIDEAGQAIELESYAPARTRTSGTEICLSGLRHAWTEGDRAAFVAGAESFAPPEALVGALRPRVGSGELLLGQPKIRDGRARTDPGFRIHLTGDFAFSSEHWDELIESVEWVLEIDANEKGVSLCVAPTERELDATDGHAKRRRFDVSHPNPVSGPFFQARIFARARHGTKLFRGWSKEVAGIRVYSEGFRVLPYGAPDNDWLEVNRDYAARSRQLRLIEENKQLAEEVNWTEDDDFALTILPSDSYVGAVLLTRERSGDLEMLVNREGFVPNRAFENLKDLTRLGIDLLTRARAAGRQAKREAARAARAARAQSDPRDSSTGSGDDALEPPPPSSWVEEVGSRIESSRAEMAGLRASMAAGKTKASEQTLARLEEENERLAIAVNALLAEQRLTPILASVGIQMAEFVHEINGLLALVGATDAILERLRGDPDSFGTTDGRRAMGEAHQTLRDLRARLERQASYLIDLTAPAAVRRRSRQRLAARLDSASQLVRPALERRGITLVNRISPELRTPPMFPAELTAVLLNLLTNAVKAAGEGGRILASAKQVGESGGVRLRLENTGERVDLEAAAERWFRPFETTTTEVDPLLGQGMGFGLPITRGILDEYGAHIGFVAPRKGYATAIQLEFLA